MLHQQIAVIVFDNSSVLAAANLLQKMGATQVFVFGSLTKNRLRPNSDVDLVDLDDPTPLVLHLIDNGELVRVA